MFSQIVDRPGQQLGRYVSPFQVVIILADAGFSLLPRVVPHIEAGIYIKEVATINDLALLDIGKDYQQVGQRDSQQRQDVSLPPSWILIVGAFLLVFLIEVEEFFQDKQNCEQDEQRQHRGFGEVRQ